MPRWATRDYSDMPMPSETDRAWAAGFWDGEGSTSPYGRARDSDGLKPGIRMYVSQKDTGPELLSRFLAIVGVGEVKERNTRPGVWTWTCQNSAGCNRAIEVMWPYLGSPKQLQIERVRDTHEPSRK